MSAARTGIFVLVVGAAGCAAVLGIPSEIDRAEPAPVEGGVPEAGPPDAPPDTSMPDAAFDAGDADAEPPPVLCDITKEFDPPVALTSVNTAEEDGAARLSEDELTIYIDGVRSAVSPSFGIFYAERTSLTDSFGPLKQFPSLDNSIDTSDDEYSPNVTADGLTLMFERKNLATSNSDIFTATRATKNDPFGHVSSVANLNTPDYEANVFVRGDTKQLWHVRKPNPNLNNIDIALATLNPTTGYVIATVDSVNTGSYDGSPVISKNGLALYFASGRPSGGPLGNNIWVATRATPTAPFNAAVLVANVNSDSGEYPGFISGDGCRLYLVSDRPSGQGGQDIYVATRPK